MSAGAAYMWAGKITGHASITFSVGGVSLTRATGDSHTGDSADAVKPFVDAFITIGPAATTKVGKNHTFTVTATDVAGNTTTVTNNYIVIYAITLPALKSPAQQGSAVPINWTLKDALGNTISNLSTLVKMESVYNGPAPAGCSASTVGMKETLYSPATGATGGSSFRLVSGGYQFNWDTTTTTRDDPSIPGVDVTCKGNYTVLIHLNDGSAARSTTTVQLK